MLLNWFVTFLGYRREVRQTFDNIYKPLIVRAIPFRLRSTLKLHIQNTTGFGVPYQPRKWDTVLRKETSIVVEMVHNLPWMHKEGWSSFWQHH